MNTTTLCFCKQLLLAFSLCDVVYNVVLLCATAIPVVFMKFNALAPMFDLTLNNLGILKRNFRIDNWLKKIL